MQFECWKNVKVTLKIVNYVTNLIVHKNAKKNNKNNYVYFFYAAQMECN